MALNETDLDRIGDKIKIKMLEALTEHKKSDHDPLERRINKFQRYQYWFHGLQASASAFVAALKGHQ